MNNDAKTALRVTLAALMTGLLGCGGGGDSSVTAGSGTGSLSLSITDAPVDNASNVFIEFTGVEIKPEQGRSYSIEFPTPRRLDLLTLTGGTAEVLLDGEILSAGTYSWIRLNVNASEGGDPADDSYIVVSGVSHELRIPSADQSGLKLNRSITIPENGSASFTIDFDLRKSIHLTGGGVYQLRPTLRLIDNSTDGTLSGSVDSGTITAQCIAGTDIAAVYLYAGHDITPSDINIDGDNVEPVATAPVDWVNLDYDYTLAYLEAGDYTAAFTCDAIADQPSSDEALVFVGTANVSINAGQTTTLNF